MMAQTMILPAALRYQTEVATSVSAAKAAGIDPSAQLEMLKNLSATVGEFQKATSHLDHALAHHAAGDVYAHAKYSRDSILPAMGAVRVAGRQAGNDGRRRPLAAADLSGDAVHQVKTHPAPLASRGRGVQSAACGLAWASAERVRSEATLSRKRQIEPLSPEGRGEQVEDRDTRVEPATN